MVRTLPSAVNTAIQQTNIYAGYLLELEFDSGTEYFWTGAGDLSYNGNTYTGAGDFGNISGFSEKNDLTSNIIEVSLSHIETDAMADLVNEFTNLDPVGRGFVLRMAFFTEAGAIDDVLTLTSGFIDGAGFTDGQQGALKIQLASETVRINRKNYKRFTAQDQEAIFSGDLGLAYVTDLEDEIVWGSATPRQNVNRGMDVYESSKFGGRDFGIR